MARQARKRPAEVTADETAGVLRHTWSMAAAMLAAALAEKKSFQENIHHLHSALSELLLAKRGEGVTLDADAVHVLAKSLDLVIRARRTDAELLLKILADLRPEETDDADRQGPGLSPEMVAEIKSRVLGIKVRP